MINRITRRRLVAFGLAAPAIIIPRAAIGLSANLHIPPIDIFLIAGQSNASGRGSLAALPTFTYRDRVRVWLNNGTGWAPGFEPMDADSPGPDQYPILDEGGIATAGPCMAFGNKFAELRPIPAGTPGRQVGVVVCARGGTFLATDWAHNLSTATLYGATVARTLAALAASPPGSRIAGGIWYQGESEAIDGTGYPTWEADFNARVGQFRSDLGISAANMPWIVTVLCQQPSSGFSFWPQMVALQQTMSLPTNAYVVSANDLPNQGGSSPHLTTAGYVTIGERYATQMNSVVSSP